MNDAEAVMLNAMARYVAAQKRGKAKRKAEQAKATREEPEGHRHKKDPWNDQHKYSDMRLYLCSSAKETLRVLKHGSL